MEENIKVYIKVNEDNEVTEIDSEIFIRDFTGWVKIDEGQGDRFAHAQGQYLSAPLIAEDGSYNFVYEDGEVKPKGENYGTV